MFLIYKSIVSFKSHDNPKCILLILPQEQSRKKKTAQSSKSLEMFCSTSKETLLIFYPNKTISKCSLAVSVTGKYFIVYFF